MMNIKKLNYLSKVMVYFCKFCDFRVASKFIYYFNVVDQIFGSCEHCFKRVVQSSRNHKCFVEDKTITILTLDEYKKIALLL